SPALFPFLSLIFTCFNCSVTAATAILPPAAFADLAACLANFLASRSALICSRDFSLPSSGLPAVLLTFSALQFVFAGGELLIDSATSVATTPPAFCFLACFANFLASRSAFISSRVFSFSTSTLFDIIPMAFCVETSVFSMPPTAFVSTLTIEAVSNWTSTLISVEFF
ncbi:hypothetical protein FF38_07927, partial [Lucilia cuprina]